MTRLVIHIDRLVLTGIEPGERLRFSRALQSELARNLGHAGAAADILRAGDRRELEAGKIRAGGTGDAAPLGQAVARRIARSIRR